MKHKIIEIIEENVFKSKFIYHFERYGINSDEKIIKNFYSFYKNIIAENQKYNLTAITDADDMIVKHFADSVMILKYFDIPQGAKIIDIGTGAGFPTVPLYIMREDLNITFLDSSDKKINFVRSAVSDLKIKSSGKLSFICGRAEEIARNKNFREYYDFAVSRAVAGLNILCELAIPLICSGGHFIAYKGKNADIEISEAESAIKALESKLICTHEFDIYSSSKLSNAEDNLQISKVTEAIEANRRVLIQIKKIKNTSTLYPRNYAKITKKPL